jgi:peptidoglycan/LPS O-acetylase OafA/YrhL
MVINRMPKSSLKELEGRVPSLDGLRAVSILMVVTSHALLTCDLQNAALLPAWVEWLFNGDLGVRIFFVISGFIITLLLLKEEVIADEISLTEFYKRRAIRILPPYFSMVLAVFALNNILELGLTRNEFIAAITFTTGWWQHQTWMLGHSWSLSVEEQFYLLWPLTLLLVRKKTARYRLVIAALIIFPLMRVGVYQSALADHRFFIIITQGDSILCGCGLAMLLFHEGERVKRWMTLNVAIGQLICLTLIFVVTGLQSNATLGILTVPFANTIFSLAIAWLIGTAILNRGVVYNTLNSRPFVFVGTVSYSWYLWQQLFLVPCGRYENLEDLSFPVNVVLSFVVGMASYYVIEQTSKKLRNV